MPPELITMGLGAVSGFLFKLIATNAANKQAQFEMFIKTIQEKDNSSDKAANRVPIDVGKGIRRIIVLATLFGVILAPFLMTIFGFPIVVQLDETPRSWFYGLFQTGGHSKFIELNGYLLIPEVRQTLTALIGFYFGQASAKNG